MDPPESYYTPSNPTVFREWTAEPVSRALHKIESSPLSRFLVLKQLQIIHRHGARTPAGHQPESWQWQKICRCAAPFPNPGEIPCFQHQKYGELTTVGRDQMRDLGRVAKKFYMERMKLLPNNLREAAPRFELSSSPAERSRESLKHFFGEWFPETKEIGCPHITLRTDVYFDRDICPRLRELESQWKSTPEFLEWKKENKDPLYKSFPDFDTPPEHSPIFLWDRFEIHRLHTNQTKLPDKMSPELFRKLELSGLKTWMLQNEEPQLARLGIGRLFETSSRALEDRAHNHQSSKNLIIVGAHDTSVGPFMAAFKVLKRWPPISSMVFLELWKVEDIEKAKDFVSPEDKTRLSRDSPHSPHFVRLVYNDQVVSIPACQDAAIENGTLCPLDRYFEITSQFIPKNFGVECLPSPKAIRSKHL